MNSSFRPSQQRWRQDEECVLLALVNKVGETEYMPKHITGDLTVGLGCFQHKDFVGGHLSLHTEPICRVVYLSSIIHHEN